MSVILDTGFIFGFLNKDDVRHTEAKTCLKQIVKGEFGQVYTSDYVVDELFTLIRARTRNEKLEEAARRFLPLPEPVMGGLILLSVAPRHLQATLDAFRSHRSLSFTDASHLALLDAYDIDRLATFDEDLASLVPSLP